MRKSRFSILLLPAAALLLAACGGSSYGGSSAKPAASSAASPSATAGALVKSASNASLGETVLVDSSGMTLYALSGERAGHFICANGACTSLWHPLSAGSGSPAGAVGSLGTAARPDGSMQVTYQGKPLYTFAQDKRAGEAGGQGFKDVGTWSAVQAGGQSAASGSSGGSGAAAGSGGAASGSGGEAAPAAGGYKY